MEEYLMTVVCNIPIKMYWKSNWQLEAVKSTNQKLKAPLIDVLLSMQEQRIDFETHFLTRHEFDAITTITP